MNDEGAPLALVTGGLQRLGAAIGERLADEGFALAIHARRSGEIDERLAAALARNGTAHELFEADLAVAEEVEGIVPAVERRFGRSPTLLVNNAGLISEDDWRSADYASQLLHLQANAVAPILLAQRVAARATAEAPALIVNILDQRIAQPHRDQFSYTLSKLALASATRLLATVMAPNVRVVGIAPGLTIAGPEYRSEQLETLAGVMPLGRCSTPTDIADAVAYCWRARAVTGQILFVDGGANLKSFERDFVYL